MVGFVWQSTIFDEQLIKDFTATLYQSSFIIHALSPHRALLIANYLSNYKTISEGYIQVVAEFINEKFDGVNVRFISVIRQIIIGFM